MPWGEYLGPTSSWQSQLSEARASARKTLCCCCFAFLVDARRQCQRRARWDVTTADVYSLSLSLSSWREESTPARCIVCDIGLQSQRARNCRANWISARGKVRKTCCTAAWFVGRSARRWAMKVTILVRCFFFFYDCRGIFWFIYTTAIIL